MSADRALAAAMRDALLAHDDVQVVLGHPARVYDDPPPDPIFPYVTFGRFESKPADASGGEGTEHAVTLHVWSRYGGRAEALDAIAAMRAALHNTPLAVEGRTLVLLLAQFTDVFRSGDGRTTHGVLRMRAIIHAYWGRAVVRSRFAPWWRARCAAAFAFPDVSPWPS